jgi:hypothetical protein
VGIEVGWRDGCEVGCRVGWRDGCAVGRPDGWLVGNGVALIDDSWHAHSWVAEDTKSAHLPVALYILE